MLQLCQKYHGEIVNYPGISADPCPTNTVAALESIKQFSKWVELNYNGMKELLDAESGDYVKSILISFGSKEPMDKLIPLPEDYNWQALGIFQGDWRPINNTDEFEKIYKLDSSTNPSTLLLEDIVSCYATNSCETFLPEVKHGEELKSRGKAKNVKGHLDHLDIGVE